MIRFLGNDDHGNPRVAVVDYSRESNGEHEFTFRPIRVDETITMYLDRIMNAYWWETGKNKRRYQDD